MKNFKSILITGASSGIGKALAESLAGPNVFLAVSGRDEARLNAVAASCQAMGATVETRTIDVTDQSAMREWIESSDANHSFDLVIANAGVSPGTSGKQETAAKMRRMLDINVNGVLNTIDPIIPKMVERNKGSIGLVSSLAGFRGVTSAPGYGASKAWVRSYGEGLRAPLASEGVNVSVICPGFVASRITDQNHFYMPRFMDAPKAAGKIIHGLKKNQGRIAFPFSMYLIVWLLMLLPVWLTDGLLNLLPKKE